jgi:hypothetical protein
MNSDTDAERYLDGNGAAGELSEVFAVDVTAAEVQCAHCGAKAKFAEARLYLPSPGIVARCSICDHVIPRFVNTRNRLRLDIRGMNFFGVVKPCGQS